MLNIVHIKYNTFTVYESKVSEIASLCISVYVSEEYLYISLLCQWNGISLYLSLILIRWNLTISPFYLYYFRVIFTWLMRDSFSCRLLLRSCSSWALSSSLTCISRLSAVSAALLSWAALERCNSAISLCTQQYKCKSQKLRDIHVFIFDISSVNTCTIWYLFLLNEGGYILVRVIQSCL